MFLSKTDTLQTLPNKQQADGTNKNVIASGIVRRPSNRNSSFKNSVVSNTQNSSEKVEVSDRTNQKPDVISKNVALNTTNDEIKNALKAKNVLCVSYANNVLISCHDNCIAKYKLNMRSKVRRALFNASRIVKSMFKDATPVIVDSGCSKHMMGDRSLQKKLVEKFMGTVRFRNDHFAAITGYGDYVQVIDFTFFVLTCDLSFKVIVEYKLLKEGIMVHFQLIRADGSSKRYSSMIRMLQDIDRKDLETLWKLVKTKHGDLRLEDEHERVL
ncbi:hypothetical protein Tco_0977476 [Tanacetum coccineum]|uniref:Retrovirus-related Pol polyprotein from transposon TNT 1-94-like beta-barrel domain-containing protein n=1 Tax=Tanacetum coccineum TaxID=301880 RepID=A0ABQ5EK69_9ASTR